ADHVLEARRDARRQLRCFPTRRSSDLLLPQASGDAPLIAVDVADGEELWEFREDEAALSPAFAAGGYVYGAARGADDAASSQVVDRKSTGLNSSDVNMSYALLCLQQQN